MICQADVGLPEKKWDGTDVSADLSSEALAEEEALAKAEATPPRRMKRSAGRKMRKEKAGFRCIRKKQIFL
jgi:hypothetical protein